MSTTTRSLIVLNNDTVICEDCYELSAPGDCAVDWDYGLWPMAGTASGECSICGYNPAKYIREEDRA